MPPSQFKSPLLHELLPDFFFLKKKTNESVSLTVDYFVVVKMPLEIAK